MQNPARPACLRMSEAKFKLSVPLPPLPLPVQLHGLWVRAIMKLKRITQAFLTALDSELSQRHFNIPGQKDALLQLMTSHVLRVPSWSPYRLPFSHAGTTGMFSSLMTCISLHHTGMLQIQNMRRIERAGRCFHFTDQASSEFTYLELSERT